MVLVSIFVIFSNLISVSSITVFLGVVFSAMCVVIVSVVPKLFISDDCPQPGDKTSEKDKINARNKEILVFSFLECFFIMCFYSFKI